jgi:transglutaminase-like putative cysteine protease
MKLSRKLAYFVCFVGLAVTAALSIARVGIPSIAPLLAGAAAAAAVAGAPGLIHRRAWPIGLVLLPLGAYLIARAQMPVPPHVHGLGGQAAFYLGQLRSGAASYAAQEFPLALGNAPALRLLLSLTVFASIGLAAFAALSLRRPLPAIVIALVLLGFSLTVDGVGRVLSLPLAFFFLAGCLLMLSRSLRRERWRRGDALAGAATALVASLLALSLLGATSLAASKPWRDWRAWGPVGIGGTRLFFDWMQNFPRLLDPRTDVPVMRVTSPVPSYWRANALDYFNGTAWLSGEPYGSRLVVKRTSRAYSYAVPVRPPQPAGRLVTEGFALTSIYSDYFFTGGTPTTLILGRDVPVFTNSTGGMGIDQPLGPKLSYSLTAIIPDVAPTDLIGRGSDYPEAVLRNTTLPFPTLSDLPARAPESRWRTTMSDSLADREWLGLYQLNRDIVGEAADPYEIALQIEEYLRSRYSYSLRPPDTDYLSPYAAFLFQTRIGYCQHFAGAMAVLLRFNGIPARVAVGFSTGRRVKNDTFEVSTNDAHAWVEVYFPHVGWVPFDPTPGHGVPGPSSVSAGSANRFASGSSAGGAGLSASPSASPRRQQDPGNGTNARGLANSPTHSGTPGWLAWIIALAALLAAWPLGRVALRQRGLRRGSIDGRLRASLALLYAELRDYGVAVSRSQTLEETSSLLKQELGLDASRLADRVQAVLFGGRAATRRDLADLTELRREMRRRLRARSGWVTAVRARYGLASATR